MSIKRSAAVAIAALAIYSCGGAGDEGVTTTDLASTTTTETPETTTTTTATTTTTTEPTPRVDPEEALSIAEEYFEAYNSGESERVLSLFVPEPSFSDNFGAQSRTTWERLLEWNMAQGTQLRSVECDAIDEMEQSVTIVCEHTNLDAVVQAVEGPPVPVTLTLTVTSDGISDWEFIFGQPDFLAVLGPFGEWMSANHPDDANKIGFGNWNSKETAAENGGLMAQYAEVWKTYLADKGCAFSDGC